MSGHTFTMSEVEFRYGDNNYEGRCTACGAEADGCEPDAREYKCQVCGAREVYGLAELLILGLINIVEGEDEGSYELEED